MTKEFEEFLQDQFIKGYSGIKDDCEDAFDNWLSNLDVQELIDYANEWGEIIRFEDYNKLAA